MSPIWRQPADRGDTKSLIETVEATLENLLDVQLDPATADCVHDVAREEGVADKGYHSNKTMTDVSAMGIRSYVSEPDRGKRNWKDKAAARDAAYANRRRMHTQRGKALLRQRGEYVERPFAHCDGTGGMRRTHLRGHPNILKRLLIHVGGFNLGLVMRRLCGIGRPRRLRDGLGALAAAVLRLFGPRIARWAAWWRARGVFAGFFRHRDPNRSPRAAA